jgi:hypothetical protein
MFGKKLVHDKSPAAAFETFTGATTEIDDDGRIIGYVPRGDIVVNIALVNAAYDHTILTGGHKVRVMETLEEIRRKLEGR